MNEKKEIKFKKIVLTILSVTLMVSILSASASAVYFGASSTGGYSGIALLEPSYASCKASTTKNFAYNGTQITRQTVTLQAKFVNETAINKEKSINSTAAVEVTAMSVLGSGFSWAESIHTQTIGGTTYRKDLSA